MKDDEDEDFPGIDWSKAVRNPFLAKNLKFECAPQEKIRFLEPLAREFLASVLKVDFDEWLITDESCVHDFITEETPRDYRKRARELFDIELPKHALLVDILAAITPRSPSPPAPPAHPGDARRP
jgi:hypothetical protein